ncbi:nuclear transport factor 2 family protein, partial [Litorivivens sp.]
MTDLERRLARLEAESDIQKLRYRYWFAILDKDVNALVNCFTPDAFLEYGMGIELSGTEAIRSFFDMVLHSEDLVKQMPRGANGLLDITSDTTASGRWLVQVILLRHSEQVGSRINVQYFENYEKIDGEWKIKRMKNDYLS